MKEEIIIAGFGGQGVMSMGRLLAYSGMKEGYEVSWMPSYGPEMRGGTANCTVMISDKKIPSPLSSKPDTVIAMNYPSLKKFAPMVKSEGTVFLNSSLIDADVGRDDVEVVKKAVNDIANELGNSKVANMVMAGAYVDYKKIMKIVVLKESLKDVFPERRHNLIPLNEKAIDKGIS